VAGAQLIVPRRAHIGRVDESDPLPYYYLPVVGEVFRERLRLALRLLGERRYGRILEAGYGSGILLPTLAALADEVHGMDLHRRPALPSRMLAREGVQAALLVGTVTALSYASESFDAVVCLSTLEHLHGAELRAALGELQRVLKRDGVAIVGVPASGWVMDLLFRAIGFAEIGEHHVSAHDDIETLLRERFNVEGDARLPSFAPRSAALYTVFRCRRRA
jgi:2-polyprenyl-3-methyl-5-hydroxy-6-metoxy-1,4-benzoquinol methylase